MRTLTLNLLLTNLVLLATVGCQMSGPAKQNAARPLMPSTISKSEPAQGVAPAIPPAFERPRPISLADQSAASANARGKEVELHLEDNTASLPIKPSSPTLSALGVVQASHYQVLAEGQPVPMNVDLIPGHNPNMVPADPNSVFGGPKYPKQQLPFTQSVPGAGAAMPIYGMIIGQMPGNCDCGPNKALSTYGGACGPDAGFGAARPLSMGTCGNNWRPEGISCPWPTDEYLCDGGDNDAHVRVQSDWSTTGVDIEDTVAHYDTLDGRIIVEPSNRVCIYAPRFSAVRRVDSLYAEDQHVRAGGLQDEMGPKRVDENLPPLVNTQPIAAIGEVGRKRVTIYDGHDRGIPVSQSLLPLATVDRVKAAGDFTALMALRIDESQKPFLAKKSLAAITWTGEQAVQAIIDGVKAKADQGSQGVQIVYRVDTGKPRLRIIKAASTSAANTGDEIQFVLRFDNIGEQPIGNVTIIDSLTTRLEYVPDSQQSSLPSKFGTQENFGESLVLRWEINEPIKAGDGGVIVFKCKVR
jgi:uncharacterized repeat protein (TIGR01451 family)